MTKKIRYKIVGLERVIRLTFWGVTVVPLCVVAEIAKRVCIRCSRMADRVDAALRNA